MVMLMFTRFINIRNVLNINHFGAAGNILNAVQHSNVISKSYSIDTIIDNETNKQCLNKPESLKEKSISKAMKIHLEKSKNYKEFMEKQVVLYNIGKRHLANMMGVELQTLDQENIDKAIRYLFPSGLYDAKARPLIKDPNILYANQKEAAFAESGRPHHFLFYTTKPNYYEVLHKIVQSINCLNVIEDQMIITNRRINPEDQLSVIGSVWLTKEQLEQKLLETLSLPQYEYFITSMERIVNHPVSKKVEDFIMEFRKPLVSISPQHERKELQYDSDGRPFIVFHSSRKSSRGKVKVIGDGTGNITINGEDITYFHDIQHREQVIFPLMFTDMYDKVDIEATVSNGGSTGQAGVVRLGIAKGLRYFVSDEMNEKMRIAGLLTTDWRKRERKKPGQEGARRKFTWKKR